jgi:hypothetical protein
LGLGGLFGWHIGVNQIVVLKHGLLSFSFGVRRWTFGARFSTFIPAAPLSRRPYITRIRAAIQGAGELRQVDRIFYCWDLSEIKKVWDLDPDFDPDPEFDFNKSIYIRSPWDLNV